MDSWQIAEKREEITRELENVLKKIGSWFTIENVREAIYKEEDTADFTDLIAMFDAGQGAENLQSIVDLLSDAWNYFPHKILNGKSPAEMR